MTSIHDPSRAALSPPPPVVAIDDLPDRSPASILEYPSGTTVRFVLLVLVVVLTGGFIGNWMYLSVRAAGDPLVPPSQWLWVPPLAILSVASVLTMAVPRWLERRRRWSPVPPALARPAVARYRTLVTVAGVHEAPSLVWNDADEGARALAYGRPGAYRIAVSPALLGAARRRPAVFDAVVGHELAHVRHHDVALAYFAVCVWYALLPALAVPLVWRIEDRDLSLVPEYLLRVALLIVLVYLVRAAVLRSREHYADVRAGAVPQTAAALVSTFQTTGEGHTRFSALSLHPRSATRARIVSDPMRLARVSPFELFTVGVTTTWLQSLLADLLGGGDPGRALRAAQVSRWLAFALAGAYAGAVLVRWAGAKGSHRDVAAAAVGLVAGMSVGSTFSLANTGLWINAGADIAGAAVAGIACGAYLLWSAELASAWIQGAVSPHKRRVTTRACLVITAAVFALVADASLGITELVRLGATAFVGTHLIATVASRSASAVLAILLVTVGIATAVIRVHPTSQRRRYMSPATGVALGILAALVLAAIHLRARQSGGSFDASHYYDAVVWTITAAGVIAAAIHLLREPRQLPEGPVVAGFAIVVAVAGFIVAEDVGFGSTLTAESGVEIARDVAAVAVLVVPVASGIVSLFAPAVAAVRPAVKELAGAALVIAMSAITVAVLPSSLTSRSSEQVAPTSDLESYVSHQVSLALYERNAAVSFLNKIPMSSPSAAPLIRSAVLAQYDNALRAVDGYSYTSPAVTKVRDALRAWLEAERASVSLLADAVQGRASWDGYAAASSMAQDAGATWSTIYQNALQAISGSTTTSKAESQLGPLRLPQARFEPLDVCNWV